MYRRRRGTSRRTKAKAQGALNRAEEERRRRHDETLRRKDILERELRVRNSLAREAHRENARTLGLANSKNNKREACVIGLGGVLGLQRATFVKSNDIRER
ncbi:uncharacterized protein LY89DRAFT_677964 [Mollisia scopiformis]|uniref:Uncharacterized protein n=1 Tax=Mollisia scopiformis TaxID=149040 RepID=A0A132B4U5_MOLSC|nr:uncharacterized protein LY89DRAFT_677964 [Mollisia scopiformis]KUJ07351.1 hypothetical protein LY89DRAFT_677964 [Mollisia scopiformis]